MKCHETGMSQLFPDSETCSESFSSALNLASRRAHGICGKLPRSGASMIMPQDKDDRRN